jgi:hypothetical protein
MNTLSRAITAQILPNADTYLALRRHWSTLLRSERKHELTAMHHLLYLTLLGKDWRKAFTPVTNARKLENGAFYDGGLFYALHGLHRRGDEAGLLAPFGGLVSTTMLEQMRALVPLVSPYHYGPDDFVSPQFPFQAYSVPDELHAPLPIEDSTHA